MTVDNTGGEGGGAAGTSGESAGAGTATGGDSTSVSTAGGKAGGVDAASAGAAGAAAAAAPVFTPNFKFNYRTADKERVEGEFGDLYKPLIKDAKTEQEIRDMHTRAHSLDFVNDRYKKEYEPLKTAHEAQTSMLRQLGGYVQKGDLHSFFSALKIPQEAVMRYALQQAQLAKDPAALAAFQERHVADQRATELAQYNESLVNQVNALAVQQRTFELDHVMGTPNASEAATAYDTRMGRAGAFRDAVIQRGQYLALATGVDAPASQVVNEVLTMIGHQAAGAGTPGAAAVHAGAGASAAPKVLPRIDGNAGTSPAKKVVRSTADLRKLGQAMGAG